MFSQRNIILGNINKELKKCTVVNTMMQERGVHFAIQYWVEMLLLPYLSLCKNVLELTTEYGQSITVFTRFPDKSLKRSNKIQFMA